MQSGGGGQSAIFERLTLFHSPKNVLTDLKSIFRHSLVHEPLLLHYKYTLQKCGLGGLLWLRVAADQPVIKLLSWLM